MTPISYQAMLGAPGMSAQSPFVALGPTSISTRRRDAKRTLTVRISKKQQAWLEHVEAVSGEGIDVDAVVRALLDLGRELDIDWALRAGGAGLRDAVRESVRVRRTSQEH